MRVWVVSLGLVLVPWVHVGCGGDPIVHRDPDGGRSQSPEPEESPPQGASSRKTPEAQNTVVGQGAMNTDPDSPSGSQIVDAGTMLDAGSSKGSTSSSALDASLGDSSGTFASQVDAGDAGSEPVDLTGKWLLTWRGPTGQDISCMGQVAYNFLQKGEILTGTATILAEQCSVPIVPSNRNPRPLNGGRVTGKQLQFSVPSYSTNGQCNYMATITDPMTLGGGFQCSNGGSGVGQWKRQP